MEKGMKIDIDNSKAWYHGSNVLFDVLIEGSTITQWYELAEAFSHKPSRLSYDDEGVITHNGTEEGYMYIIEDAITMGVDVYPHPSTTMTEYAEFLTKRPLQVKRINTPD